jgi:hypothetical protein
MAGAAERVEEGEMGEGERGREGERKNCEL